MRPAFAVVILLIIPCAFLSAQSPHQEWKTLETKHFRVHYPAEYEAWTLGLAPKMEAIHAVVAQEVGYTPEEVVDILVMDPLSLSNGMALPFLNYPRMILWTTPPEPWSPIGHYRDWPELVFLHEDVHLVHLLRPGRGPVARLKEHVLPLGPIDLKAPRWVSEGYATYLEGKLTGVGRPNGDFRAAILRKWALEGKLPSYGQMASDSESWLGMSMAYLMGSAYMEWLVERTDADALKRLWARLTAKKDRSFDAAFEGVFGDPPAKLYDRFTADLTWRAKQLEKEMAPVLAEGELWQDTAWTTGEPALSPDGTKMAIVLRVKDAPSRLVVWDTQPDPEAQKRWDEDIARIRKTDPEDVPGVRAKPFPTKERYRMPVAAAREPMNPRWLPDGKSILFTSYEPDLDGFYSPDLFLWTPETGDVRRVTRGAHVKEADPFPDGRRAVAVRSRFGMNALAEVDLADGSVELLTEPSLDVIHAQPRVSPDGTRVAVVMHANGGWSLVIMDFEMKSESMILIPEGALPSYPAWGRDGKSVFASIGAGGFIDIYRSDPGLNAMGIPITHTMGAAIAAEPSPDGKSICFLSLEPDGLDVRSIPLEPGVSMLVNATPDPALAPAIRPVPPQGLEFQRQEISASKPYGAGRQEFSLLFGGTYAPSAHVMEIGARGGDVLGRWDYFALYSHASEKGPDGGAFAVAFRGWPVELTAHSYSIRETPDEFDVIDPGYSPGEPYLERQGIELKARKQWIIGRGSMQVTVGGLWERFKPERYYSFEERPILFSSLFYDHVHPLRGWQILGSVRAREAWGRMNHSLGSSFSYSFMQTDVTARLGIKRLQTGCSLSYDRRRGRNNMIYRGGTNSSVLPESASWGYGRVLDPALTLGWVGDEYEGWRVDLSLGGLPLFFQRHESWLREFNRMDNILLDLAGLEWDMTSGPLAIARLPGFHLTLGAARILDGADKDENKYWLGLSWRP